ncbi:hypothetical protein CDN99_24980 [Roseateles aquatilis]|uniref:Uncharacterized protein n=1 Tax=Roseateles aquatilis TaxID=431061 RepID=A0A246IV83_9BURK|nr:hypothetical protein [Roseateles aquatilis]OWQ84135.1 hypothetical protein CDN99_24980 [Roseateles aquatilis]
MIDDQQATTRLVRVMAGLSLAAASVLAAVLLQGCASARGRDDPAHPYGDGWRTGWVMEVRTGGEFTEPVSADCRAADPDAARHRYALMRYSRARHWRHVIVAIDDAEDVAVGARYWFRPSSCDGLAAPQRQE